MAATDPHNNSGVMIAKLSFDMSHLPLFAPEACRSSVPPFNFAGSPGALHVNNMPTPGFGRCDRDHETVDYHCRNDPRGEAAFARWKSASVRLRRIDYKEGQPHSRPIAGGINMYDKGGGWKEGGTITAAAFFAVGLGCQTASAQETRITKTDAQIDALDPGIRLFVREKMQEGNTQFTNENIVLFLHGATAPSTCDFDLAY